MSRFRRYHIVERAPPSYPHKKTSIFTPRNSLTLTDALSAFPMVKDQLHSDLDLLDYSNIYQPSLFNEFDAFTDLTQIDKTPSFHSSHRVHSRQLGLDDHLNIQTLSDRVSDLELGFDRLVRDRTMKKRIGERKYTWTTEIKDWEGDRKCKLKAKINDLEGDRKCKLKAKIKDLETDRKFKLTAKIKDKNDVKKVLDESYSKWKVGIKGKGVKYSPNDYRVKASSGYMSSSGSSGSYSEKEKGKMMMMKKKKGEKVKSCKVKFGGSNARTVEIHDPSDHRAMYLRQAYAKRMDKRKGKRKELSPQDAAALIQTRFRTHLFRRSHALRALRELAIARNKFKEIKAFFNNFSYRRRMARDAEERQKFSETIIVLLLTVEGIEGSDLMVRAARKLMVEELEAMLDVVDPQPQGKSLSMRNRRTFDMPGGIINKELAAGVAQVVQMLDQEASGSESFEASL